MVNYYLEVQTMAKTILIIEDEEQLCRSMAEGLCMDGYETVGNIERFAFYEEAKTAYCIISTSEKALYANIMLQKGVVINN